MNRIIVILATILVIIGAVIVGVMIFNQEGDSQQNTIVEDISEKENTVNEVENVINNTETNFIETNSSEERISPNAFITFKQTYKECGHTTSEFVEVPQEFVNLSEEELKEKYTDWTVEKFSDTDIVLSKEVEGSCDEHYVVRDVDGTVIVYKILENGSEEEYMVTDIATEYLTDTDKIEIEEGIKINGKQNLNQLLEDYE